VKPERVKGDGLIPSGLGLASGVVVEVAERGRVENSGVPFMRGVRCLVFGLSQISEAKQAYLRRYTPY